MRVQLAVTDLQPFLPAGTDQGQMQARIDTVMARALRLAPCLDRDDFAYPDAARGILIDVILRRVEAGTGAVAQESEASGPFSRTRTFNSTAAGRSLFWPAEITELQALCAASSTAPAGPVLPAFIMPAPDVRLT